MTSQVYNIVVAGPRGSGKTSIIQQYALHRFDADRRRSVGVDFTETVVQIQSEPVNVQFWDVTGDVKSKSLFIPTRVAGVVIVGDACVPGSLAECVKWKELIDERVHLPEHWRRNGDVADRFASCVPAVLAVNKVDDQTNIAVDESEVEHAAMKHGFSAHFRTSSKMGIGVQEAILDLVGRILLLDADRVRKRVVARAQEEPEEAPTPLTHLAALQHCNDFTLHNATVIDNKTHCVAGATAKFARCKHSGKLGLIVLQPEYAVIPLGRDVHVLLDDTSRSHVLLRYNGQQVMLILEDTYSSLAKFFRAPLLRSVGVRVWVEQMTPQVHWRTFVHVYLARCSRAAEDHAIAVGEANEERNEDGSRDGGADSDSLSMTPWLPHCCVMHCLQDSGGSCAVVGVMCYEIDEDGVSQVRIERAEKPMTADDIEKESEDVLLQRSASTTVVAARSGQSAENVSRAETSSAANGNGEEGTALVAPDALGVDESAVSSIEGGEEEAADDEAILEASGGMDLDGDGALSVSTRAAQSEGDTGEGRRLCVRALITARYRLVSLQLTEHVPPPHLVHLSWALAMYPYLLSLSVEGCPFTVALLSEFLSNLSLNPHITTLSMRRCTFDTVEHGKVVSAYLKKSSALNSIDISFNPLGDRAMENIILSLRPGSKGGESKSSRNASSAIPAAKAYSGSHLSELQCNHVGAGVRTVNSLARVLQESQHLVTVSMEGVEVADDNEMLPLLHAVLCNRLVRFLSVNPSMMSANIELVCARNAHYQRIDSAQSFFYLRRQCHQNAANVAFAPLLPLEPTIAGHYGALEQVMQEAWSPSISIDIMLYDKIGAHGGKERECRLNLSASYLSITESYFFFSTREVVTWKLSDIEVHLLATRPISLVVMLKDTKQCWRIAFRSSNFRDVLLCIIALYHATVAAGAPPVVLDPRFFVRVLGDHAGNSDGGPPSADAAISESGE